MKPLIPVAKAEPIPVPKTLWVTLPAGQVYTGVRQKWCLERNEGYTPSDDLVVWESPASTQYESVLCSWDRWQGYRLRVSVRGPSRGDVYFTAPPNAFHPPAPGNQFTRIAEIQFLMEDHLTMPFSRRWAPLGVDAMGDES